MTVSLVTGGAGFIGSHLVEALANVQKHKVRVLDNFSTGLASNLSDVAHDIEIIHGDLRDHDVVRQAVEGVDFIFHLAAPTDEIQWWKNPEETHHVGATGTLNVLSAARKCKVRRVVYASSCSVYGDPNGRPKREDELPRPLSPYSVAKLSGEQQCLSFTGMFGVETVMLRYFNVYGPRQRSASPYAYQLTQIVNAMAEGCRPIISNDLNDPLDLIYVDDVVHASLLASTSRRASGSIFNISGGRPTRSRELVKTLNKILGASLKPLQLPHIPKNETLQLADIRKAEVELGFCAGTTLEKGLRNFLEFKLQPCILE